MKVLIKNKLSDILTLMYDFDNISIGDNV